MKAFKLEQFAVVVAMGVLSVGSRAEAAPAARSRSGTSSSHASAGHRAGESRPLPRPPVNLRRGGNNMKRPNPKSELDFSQRPVGSGGKAFSGKNAKTKSFVHGVKNLIARKVRSGTNKVWSLSSKRSSA